MSKIRGRRNRISGASFLAGSHSKFRRLRVEPLEDRRLLSRVPELVADIQLGAEGSGSHRLTEVDGSLFFWGRGGIYKSDGTETGTVQVKVGIRVEGFHTERGIAEVDRILFFGGDDGDEFVGSELWRSDGTSEGTALIKDIQPGRRYENRTYYWRSSYPDDLTSVGGVLYFTAEDSALNRELWKSDGTPEGTLMVTNLRPGCRQP